MVFQRSWCLGGLVCASHVPRKQWDWHLVSLFELSGDEDVWMEMGNLCLSLGWVQAEGFVFLFFPSGKNSVPGQIF